MKKLLVLANEGRHGAHWYNQTATYCEERFGTDADIFLRFLAATSAGMGVEANVTLALRAYAQWKLGQPFEGYVKCHRIMLAKASKGMTFGGSKVQNLLSALRGNENAVAVDRWVLRAMGIKKKHSPSPKQYAKYEQKLRAIANKLGMAPREFQAALWTAFKIRAAHAAKGNKRKLAHVGSFRPYEYHLARKAA